ncbi:MAG: hypothetical protein NZ941_03690 [Candidatus Caldarchaeum sp.]|nr:hypothetical protein [Candidatus Caldarchaeum sp.]
MAENLSQLPDLGFPVKWYLEGRVRFMAPAFPTTNVGEPQAPTKWPVFYNPYSALSRDLTVVLAKTFDRKAVAAEPLAGSGVRSIRLLLETETISKALMNDVNPNAVKLARMNARINGVEDRVELYEGDAAAFLVGHSVKGSRLHYVDVDPVGAPSKFVENSLRAVEDGGYLGVSATDLASLVGNHPEACFRKYGLHSAKTFFGKEAALRLLASFVVLRAAALNVAAQPILSVYRRHFVRVFFRISRGRSRVIKLLGSLGWIQACSSLHIFQHPLESHPATICPSCSGKASVVGPAWLGPLHETATVEKMFKHADEHPQAFKTLQKIADELPVVGFYPVDQLARAARTHPPSPSALIVKLRSAGFNASLTHVDPTGVKTDAPLNHVLKVLA